MSNLFPREHYKTAEQLGVPSLDINNLIVAELSLTLPKLVEADPDFRATAEDLAGYHALHYGVSRQGVKKAIADRRRGGDDRLPEEVGKMLTKRGPSSPMELGRIAVPEKVMQDVLKGYGKRATYANDLKLGEGHYDNVWEEYVDGSLITKRRGGKFLYPSEGTKFVYLGSQTADAYKDVFDSFRSIANANGGADIIARGFGSLAVYTDQIEIVEADGESTPFTILSLAVNRGEQVMSIAKTPTTS